MAYFQTHFYRLSGYKIEMIFCQNLCISIDESLVVLRNSFIPPRIFWGSKMLKSTFLENNWDLTAVFIKLKFGWLQTCLTDMEKHKTLEMFENHQ